MYELMQCGKRTYYVNCPSKVGVFLLSDREVCLIDSGNDKDAGRKIYGILQDKGWELKAIINTHSNADHIGGNALLQERTGCVVVSSSVERSFIEHPLLEPAFFYGGFPMKALRNKHLCAAPSATVSFEKAGPFEGLEFFDLPGHFLGMIGVRTCDGVCFLADSLFSRSVLEKYHVAFVCDVRGHLETLSMLDRLEARLFVPSHCEAMEDISDLVALNRAKVREIAGLLLSLCERPMGFEEILEGVFERYGLKMDMSQYVLVGSTLKSYLAYLYDEGMLEWKAEGSRMAWCRK